MPFRENKQSAFFKLLIIIAILPFLFSLVACDAFLRDKKSSPEILEVKDIRFECLKKVPDDLKLFSLGEAKKSRIEHSVQCVQNALTYFSAKTKGSRADGYTPEDMRKFFGKYFLKENNVSSDLAQNLFLLKSAFLGGGADVITRDEIAKLNKILTVFSEESIALSPHMKLILFHAKDAVRMEDVQGATEQLRTSLLKLLSVVEISHSDYGWSELKTFLSGMAEFIRGANKIDVYDNFRSWIPVIEAAKNVFIGENPSLAGQSDWKDLVNSVVDVYGLAARLTYFRKDFGTSGPQDIWNAIDVAQMTLSSVERSYQMKRTGRIPLKAIDELIDSLYSKKLMTGLSNSSIKDTYKVMLSCMFDPFRKGETRGLVDLQKENLASLRREVNIFILGQIFVDSLPYDKKGLVSVEQIRAHFKKYKLEEVLRKSFRVDTLEMAALRQSFEEMGQLLMRPRPVFFYGDNRVLVQYDAVGTPQAWRNMAWWNLMRMASRLFLLGYGDRDSMNLLESRISPEMLAKWYDDFNSLGVEIKAFDPRSSNAGKRSFKEANFFMFSSDGLGGVDFFESFEYVSFLFSAGFNNASKLAKAGKDLQCEINELDVFGLKKMNEDCFKIALRMKFTQVFTNLPAMAWEVNRMSDAEWNVFYWELMRAARTSSATGRKIETADIRTSVMILHYVESLMVSFDQDHSQYLDSKEVANAAPRFREFLLNVMPDVPVIPKSWIVDDVFSAMVIQGEKPTGVDIMKYFFVKNFIRPQTKRVDLLKVFSGLKDALKTDAK